MSEEIRLKVLLAQDMHAKDTAVGVQSKQTARALANNIDHSDSKLRRELLAALQKREGDNSADCCSQQAKC